MTLALVSTLAALGLIALTAAPALASRAYETQLTEANGTAFSHPFGLAVDSSDNLWVTDTGKGVVDKFDPSGTFLFQGGGPPFPFSGQYIESAAWSSGGAVPANKLFVSDSGFDDVWGLNPDATYASVDLKSGLGGGCCFIKVTADNSAGSTGGDLYVSKSPAVLRIDSSGAPAPFSGSGPFIKGNELTGPFASPSAMTVDSLGNLYVAGGTKVDEFESSGELINEFKGVGAPGGFSGNLTGLAIDPSSGNLLVVDSGNGVVDEFESSGSYVGQVTGTGPSQSTPFGSLPGGIGVNSSGDVYLVDSGNQAVDVFGPNAILPRVTYGEVTNQTQTSGTLNTSVDLNGGPEVESCHFQFGPTTAYGSSIPCTPPTPYSTSPTAVSADVSGLTTETTYHYRLVLVTANGTATAVDQTYLPHAVAGLTTDPATNVERNDATLNGHFTGNGEDTHYYFEWGTDTSYGHVTPALPGTDAGEGTGPQSATTGVSGLQVETTYHYRIVAKNNTGTSRGSDRTFKTLAAVENLNTDSASELTASSATLNASFTGIGENVNYYFEWGPDASYGNKTAVPPGTLLTAPAGATNISFPLDALQIDSDYHYRVVASDLAGTTFGSDRSFHTLGAYESSYLGSVGSGDGQFSNPRDVAVDEASGDVYVADIGNHRVDKLSAGGGFIAAWGWGVDDGSAVRQVCTSGCQAGIAGSGAGQFTTPTFVEVDNSNGPSAGDVYVADTSDGVVQKFDSTGNLITGWGNAGGSDFSQDGVIGGITIDPSGNLFVLTDNAPYLWTEISQSGTVGSQFPTDGSYLNGNLLFGPPAGTGIETDGTGNFYEVATGNVMFGDPSPSQTGVGGVYQQGGSGATGLAIARPTGDLYVDKGSHIDRFSGSSSCRNLGNFEHGCNPSDTFGEGQLSAASGLAVNSSTGTVYVANSGGGNLATFLHLSVADVSTGPSEDVTSTSSIITGHVDPHGPGTISSCYFEYGTDQVYGTDQTYDLGTVPCTPGTPISAPADVSAELTGLSPFQAYHYRLVAVRSDGKGFPSFGRDQTFTSSFPLGQSPLVGGSSSSDVSPTTATLNALVNPNQEPTVYRFQYGIDTGYGTQTVLSDSIGEDAVDHAVEQAVTGLTPGTTYHYRVLATNFSGVTAGPDQTFSTPAQPTIGATSVTGVTMNAANLKAQIKPGFSPTTYRFEYGPSTAYGSATPESSSVGSDNSSHAVGVSVTGLTPGTTYHYRVLATNAFGESAGSDRTFTTLPAEPTPTPPAPCKKGFVRKHGRCVKKHHKVVRHHRGRRGHHHD